MAAARRLLTDDRRRLSSLSSVNCIYTVTVPKDKESAIATKVNAEDEGRFANELKRALKDEGAEELGTGLQVTSLDLNAPTENIPSAVVAGATGLLELGLCPVGLAACAAVAALSAP